MALMSKDATVFAHTLIVLVVILFSSNVRLSHATLNDSECLKSVKNSLEDPFKYLTTSWNFNNNTEGFICKFTGVDCWHPDENKVLNIHLSDMGLKGQFPRGIETCTSLTDLDLSSNKLSGSFPSDISNKLKYVTSLDLSSNSLSGEIPSGLANCTFLNVLKLNNNRFTGKIPLQLGLLNQIKTFSVASNLLTGPDPSFANVNFTAEDYANNPGLCGKPSNPCPGVPKKSHAVIIAAAAAAGVTFTALVVGIFLYYFMRGVYVKKEDGSEGNKWAKSMKGTEGIKVSAFEKSAAKMRLSDLMKATNSFSRNNIIGTGRTGAIYIAMLPGGCFIMIKRLEDSQHSEKEFVSQMNTLGSVRHCNLGPLLGFCVANKERLLVYEYLENMTLYNKLHPAEHEVMHMDWHLRLRIAIGSARGLAWLHHNCNPQIIHRNISSKCILLDDDLN